MACAMTMIQMRRGIEGMAPDGLVATGPPGSRRPRVGRLRRDPLPHLPLSGTVAVRLPGRVHAVGAVGGGHHHRRGVRARRPDRPGVVPTPPGVAGHHLLRRLSLALPGLRLPRCRPDRPDRTLRCWPSGSPPPSRLAAVSFYLVERPVMYGTFWRSVKAVVPAVVLMVGHGGGDRGRNGGAGHGRGHGCNERHAGRRAPGADRLAGIHHPSDPVPAARGLTGRHPGCRTRRTRVEPLRRPASSTRPSSAATSTTCVRSPTATSTYPVSPCRRGGPCGADQVAQYRPDVVGLLVGRWDITDHIDNGTVVHIGQPAWDAHLDDEIDQAVSIFRAEGARVVLFTMPYLDPPESPDGVQLSREQSAHG